MIYAGEVVLAKKYQIIKKIIIIKKSICCQTCCSLAHWPAPHWKWLLANIKSNSPLQDTVAEFSFTSCYPASEKCNSIRCGEPHNFKDLLQTNAGNVWQITHHSV